MRFAANLTYGMRHLAALAWPVVSVGITVWLLCLGAYVPTLPRGLAPVLALFAVGAAVVWRGRERWKTRWRRRRRRVLLLDLEIGLGLITLAEVAVQATGGPGSPLTPLPYLTVSLLVFFHRRSVGPLLGGSGVLLAFGVALARGHLEEPAVWVRVSFLLVFALLAYGLLRLEALRRRRQHDSRVEEEIRSLRDEARDYRLIASALGPESRGRSPAQEQQQRLQSAAYALRDSLYHVLELTHCALRPHTTALLWLTPDGRYLKIKELITASDRVNEGTVRAGEGVLGGILKRLMPVNLLNLRDPSRLPYYAGPVPVRTFLGVPVVEAGVARGVLVVDRLDDQPFDETDELFLGHAARHVIRAIENERIFTRVDRAKEVQERFYRASESFREARTLDDVYRVTCQAAHEITPWDFAAVTRCDGTRQTVARVFGAERERLEGHEFGSGAGLCSMAVKNRHELPFHGNLPGRDVAVFSPKLRLRGYESLLVLPLIARAEVLGTLVLAARSRGAFPLEAREMLRVIASQAAGSLEHAIAYDRLETLATTDGLTGLLNHRHFQDRLAELLARTDRLGKRSCLILTDIDHFKAINDTYGHPVGDQVLREVARMLGDSARKIDIVARYGGEEFALVLEETGAEGGVGLAERIRAEVAARLFHCEQGSFRVTLSLGVAVFPEDARDKDTLIDRADQALYAAKRQGRNRTVRATPGRKPAVGGAA